MSDACVRRMPHPTYSQTHCILIPRLRRASNAYFFVSAAICAGCFFVYGWVMPRMAVVTYWRDKKIEDGEGLHLT